MHSTGTKLKGKTLLSVSLSYPMSATRCRMYSDAWPMPRGNMTRLFGPIPATLGGSCRGEPADGIMADRAPRNSEPAVSISSDWFSLLHFYMTRCFPKEIIKKKEERNPFEWTQKWAHVGVKSKSRPAKALFSLLSNKLAWQNFMSTVS